LRIGLCGSIERARHEQQREQAADSVQHLDGHKRDRPGVLQR
jgi:hypothetical protein